MTRPEDDIVPRTSSPEPLVRIHHLCKTYNGHPALDHVSLELYAGDLLGLVGPNGAGKTTLLRILATILPPDDGEVELGGSPLYHVQAVRRQIGYMPDFIGDYDELQVGEYMQFFARAYEVKPALQRYAIEEALKTTDTLELKSRRLSELNQGQKQSLALARLLMHDPPILLLDEPTAGMDPEGRLRFREILSELRNKGKAIIVSSNLLEDLSELCNKLAFLDQGRLLASGTTESLCDRLLLTRRWRLRLRGSTELERARQFLEDQAQVSDVLYQGDQLLLTIRGGEDEVALVHRRLFENEFKVVEFAQEPLGLEDIYLRLTRTDAL